jgi:hypothetical protein
MNRSASNGKAILRRHWPLWAALAVFAVFVGFDLIGHQSAGGFILSSEDAYQRLAVARNLAAGSSWGINPGEFAASFGTLLWPVLLAPVFLLLGADALWAWVANVAFAAVLIVWGYRVVCRWIPGYVWRFAVLLFWMTALPLPLLVSLGMEHVLFIVILLVFLEKWSRRMDSAGGSGLISISAAALLLASTRYEGLLIVCLAAFLLLLRRDYRAAVVLPCAAALPLAVFGIFSWRAGWLPLPASVFLRRTDLIPDDLRQLPSVFLRPMDTLGSNPDLRVVALLATLLPAWFGLTGRFASWRAREFHAPALTVLCGAAFLLLIGSRGYRYDFWLIFLGIWAVLPLLAAAIPSGADFLRRNAVAAFAGGCLAFLLMVPLVNRGIQGVGMAADLLWRFRQIDQPALELVDLCTGGPVATDAPGSVAFLLNRPVVDLSGFASPEAFQERRTYMIRTEWMEEEARERSASAALLTDRKLMEKAATVWTWGAGWWKKIDAYEGDFAGILQVQNGPALPECARPVLKGLSDDVQVIQPGTLGEIP